MTPEQLIEHFDRIAEAPDAVARLRRFVLDLAVRGKLVPQDPNDEPGPELLKRIVSDTVLLVESGEIRKPKPLPPADEQPFTIPPSWVWTRLGELAELVRGVSFPASAKAASPAHDRIPCFRSGNIQAEPVWDNFIYVPEQTVTSDAQLVRVGDILISIANSYALVGKCAIVREVKHKATFGAFLAAIRLRSVLPEYAKIYLTSEFSAKAFRVGSAQTTNIANITFSTIRLHHFALPPIAEQHRIVEKVDELMAVCDELESRQQQREQSRDRLVTSTLHHLTSRASADEATEGPFNETARFYLDNLAKLTTRPEHVKQLRQAILDLAVRGKLVPQDPNDEPAAAALRRIADARSRPARSRGMDWELQGEGHVPSRPGWEQVALDELILDLQTGPFGSALHKSDYKDSGPIPVINPASIKDGRIIPIPGMSIDEDTAERLAGFRLRCDDVIMGRRGEMGRAASVTATERGWLCGTGSLILRLRYA